MRILLLAYLLVFGGQSALAATYYVNAEKGNDANTGQSKNKAWKSIYHVNQQTFQPGDKILFKAGSVFTGSLMPKGSGKKGQPIVID